MCSATGCPVAEWLAHPLTDPCECDNLLAVLVRGHWMQFDQLKRREFITLFGVAVATLPLAARAQQPERVPRIGVLMASAADDSENQARMAAFLQGLAQLGWTDGRNIRIDTRWATTNPDDLRRHATELVALAPDVLVAASGTTTVAPLLQATRTVPIVFVVVVDPVKLGLVASLARPGGNATGINYFAQEVTAKRLGLLHELVPKAVRIAVLVNPANVPATESTLRDLPEAARAIGLQIQVLKASTRSEIEAAFATLGGLKSRTAADSSSCAILFS
jgi:putative ABC transport system substrate-binding protein